MADALDEAVTAAWNVYGDPRRIVDVKDTSPDVSTNRVYRLRLDDGGRVFAKASAYGSFVHFRQDHERIHRWCQLLEATRFDGFLSRPLLRDDEVYTYHGGDKWVCFYEEAPFKDEPPRLLSEEQILAFAREMAAFHRACTEVRLGLDPTWKTLGSDIALLYDLLSSDAWCRAHGLETGAASYLRDHCNLFLRNADRLGYHALSKIPLLVDWNIGNFSVDLDDDFRLFSRWDYDWFRIEPRTLDFYFCSRVCSSVGDRTLFSYSVKPLLEPRFQLFLQQYHQVFPLQAEEIVFLREAYRFFILNYVVREGEHFFRPDICARLQQDAFEQHLPDLDRTSFDPLIEIVVG